MLFICPSIQPKHSASSKASFALRVMSAFVFPNTSQIPSLVWALSDNQLRKSSRVANINSGVSLFMVNPIPFASNDLGIFRNDQLNETYRFRLPDVPACHPFDNIQDC